VVEDYIHTKFLRIAIYGLIISIGLCLFFIGTLTIFKSANL
jgi:succinate dehydrogenase hydrophobic anchor subunit